MPLSPYRGSTQDNSTGVQVAQVINEDGSTSGALIGGVSLGNKTTYPNLTRSGVNGADTGIYYDLSSTGTFVADGLLDFSNALSAVVRADSSIASTSLSGRVIFYDGSNNPLSTSESIYFVADNSERFGVGLNYICQHQIIDVGEARRGRFFVDSISSGNWNIYVRPI